MNFTIHDAAGRILRTGFCPEGMHDIQAQTGEFVLPVAADLHADHVVGGAIAKRPANPAILTGDTITGIPPGATVSINGTDYAVDDGIAELDFPLPGTYSIVVSMFPYLPARFTVTK